VQDYFADEYVLDGTGCLAVVAVGPGGTDVGNP
jgi:hypothetical protein